MQKIIVLVTLLFTFWSCKKKPDPKQEVTPPTTSSIEVSITNVVGTTPLVYNTQSYVNANLDTFTVSLFKYYISNIKLLRQNGSFFSEPESYHLVSQDDTINSKFTIQNVPVGEYVGIEFIIGIDSTRNCSGAQTGPLDPLKDMYWDWAQGYIFAKLQGTYNTTGGYMLHVGGFTGQWSAIVKATPSFGTNKIQLSDTHSSKLFMKADVLEWFKSPTLIDIASYETVAIGKKSHEIAVNYSDMFSVAAIQN